MKNSANSVMSGLTIQDAQLMPIADKVLAGERLNFDEGIALYRTPDLLAVGWLANSVREKRHGNICYFNVNRHINPTNVCVAHCRLCAFGRDLHAPGAYTYALEEIYQRAEQGMREGATEFHLVGGLHPDLPFEYFLDLMRGLKQRCPNVHLKAFTMVEVGYFARIAKLSIRDTLVALKESGVDSLPGGGAEIFNPRVRKVICDHKVAASNGSTSRAPRTRSASPPTPPCCMATSRPKKSASSTCCCCADCRIKRTASSPTSRWPFTRKTPRWRTCPRRPVSWI
jgi:hypothetical protein